MARKSTKRNANSVRVNFKDVESRVRVGKEGDYPLKCLEATTGKSSAGNEQIEFVFEVTKGEYKGAKAWFYCPLTENSLWKLHALLTAMGVEVPEDEMDIDLGELVDLEVVGVFTPDSYNGKKSFKMTDFASIEDYEGAEDDEDEKPAKGKKSKGKPAAKGKASKKAKEPDLDDLDEDELRELYVEKGIGTAKAAKKLDEDELREAIEGHGAEDEEDDEKPAKGKPAKGKKAKKLDRDDVEDMDEDELQELIDEHDLDVDFDDKKLKKLEKKVAAVIEALEEADLLED